jgi:hypothetical protein
MPETYTPEQIAIFALEQNLRITRVQLARANRRGDAWDAGILRADIRRYEAKLAEARA